MLVKQLPVKKLHTILVIIQTNQNNKIKKLFLKDVFSHLFFCYKSMVKFLKYLTIQLMNKYGSFMWFGTHVSMTQTDWHWLVETFLCIFVNFLVIFSLYLQYIEEQNEKLQKTNSPK